MAPKGKGKAATSDKPDAKSKVSGAQSINVRHILCAKHSKKEEALARLNEGVAFNKVAEEYSEDKARAGTFFNSFTDPIVARARQLLPEFETVAFGLEASSTASPKWGECKTSEGYHLIMVEGRK
nr:Peptidyl-prolyl cis-trans isomerase PIN4 [Rachicladosporium sp. CCFEE 5018]